MTIYNAQNDSRIYGFLRLVSPHFLARIWFAVEEGSPPPPAVYVILSDRLLNATHRSNDVVITMSPPTPTVELKDYVSLTGVGTAIIDGIVTSGEWDNAGIVNFLVKVP